MAQVIRLKPNAPSEFTSALGMTVFLGSWAMMFCALFFAYGFLRSHQAVWPPVGAPPLPLVTPAINTAVLVASSVAFGRGLEQLRRGNRRALTAWVALTLALGVGFLVGQLATWRAVFHQGLRISSGLYGSVFYTLTVFHALHVVAGVVVLATVLVKSIRGSYTEHNVTNVRLCGMFWHFVDVVWILMFVSLYLV